MRPTVEARPRSNIRPRPQGQKLVRETVSRSIRLSQPYRIDIRRTQSLVFGLAGVAHPSRKETPMLPQQWTNRWTRSSARAALVAIAALVGGSCKEPSNTVAPTNAAAPTDAHVTMGQGSTPTFIGQATYYHFGTVKRETDDWDVELNAKGGLEVVVRSFAYDPGAFTGWHKHPGPVLIQVVEGTVTFFEADDPCTPIEVSAGHGYVDAGNGHIGRNRTHAPAKDVTIYFAPAGTQVPQLRIDMDEPPGAAACP